MTLFEDPAWYDELPEGDRDPFEDIEFKAMTDSYYDSTDVAEEREYTMNEFDLTDVSAFAHDYLEGFIPCDRCDSRAYVAVQHDQREDVLVFCGHHYTMMDAGLVANGYTVVQDNRHLLNTR